MKLGQSFKCTLCHKWFTADRNMTRQWSKVANLDVLRLSAVSLRVTVESEEKNVGSAGTDLVRR